MCYHHHYHYHYYYYYYHYYYYHYGHQVVVPDQQVSREPAVPKDKGRRGRVRREVAQDALSLRGLYYSI